MKLFNWFKEKEITESEPKHSESELKIIQFLRDKACEDITQFKVRHTPRMYTFIHNNIEFVITPFSVRVSDCDSILNTNYLFNFIYQCDEARLKQISDLKLQQIAENL